MKINIFKNERYFEELISDILPHFPNLINLDKVYNTLLKLTHEHQKGYLTQFLEENNLLAICKKVKHDLKEGDRNIPDELYAIFEYLSEPDKVPSKTSIEYERGIKVTQNYLDLQNNLNRLNKGLKVTNSGFKRKNVGISNEVEINGLSVPDLFKSDDHLLVAITMGIDGVYLDTNLKGQIFDEENRYKHQRQKPFVTWWEAVKEACYTKSKITTQPAKLGPLFNQYFQFPENSSKRGAYLSDSKPLKELKEAYVNHLKALDPEKES